MASIDCYPWEAHPRSFKKILRSLRNPNPPLSLSTIHFLSNSQAFLAEESPEEVQKYLLTSSNKAIDWSKGNQTKNNIELGEFQVTVTGLFPLLPVTGQMGVGNGSG